MLLFYRCFCSLATPKPWRRRVLTLVIEIRYGTSKRPTFNVQFRNARNAKGLACACSAQVAIKYLQDCALSVERLLQDDAPQHERIFLVRPLTWHSVVSF